MGSCQSEEVRTQNANNKQLDQLIQQDGIRDKTTIKLLLLGASESGKSTILKQMQIIHLEGFPEAEIEQRRPVIYASVITTAVKVANAIQSQDLERQQVQVNKILKAAVSGKESTISRTVYNAIKMLLSNPTVQQLCKEENSILRLNDREKYFLDHLDRIADKNYIPNNEDILRTRVPTTGVSDIKFQARGSDFHVFDVGGQRSERKKWIHIFDNVDAVIFVVALSEYEQLCIEDNSTNRMVESLLLFSWICNHESFIKTSMVMFFNKSDLFQDTVNRVPLKTVFPDFQSPNTYENCLEYITKKFKNLDKKAEKAIFAHVTCATDTNQVKKVTNDVFQTIVRENMKNSGI